MDGAATLSYKIVVVAMNRMGGYGDSKLRVKMDDILVMNNLSTNLGWQIYEGTFTATGASMTLELANGGYTQVSGSDAEKYCALFVAKVELFQE